jgi:hypothetical protein
VEESGKYEDWVQTPVLPKKNYRKISFETERKIRPAKIEQKNENQDMEGDSCSIPTGCPTPNASSFWDSVKTSHPCSSYTIVLSPTPQLMCLNQL